MALSRREKSAINLRLIDIKKALKSDTLGRREKSALTREWAEKLKLVGGKASPATDKVDPLIADYVDGKFNSLTIDLFIDKMNSVDAAGGTLEQIKTGAQAWVIANAERFDLVNLAA
ncbi:MAG: hypothetical protein ACRDCT_31320 [Shewanella sp.]|uniref:hypothetical protein n=1 Tax=Shewanella sp. TaxID=50422 RepID=UPI003F38DF57